MSARWSDVRRVFEEAAGRAGEERAAYLDRECRGDDALRAEVQRLLDADASDDALDALLGSDSVRDWITHHVDAALKGRRIGRWRLRRVLGSGGSGTVYEAEQDRPRRVVALKLLHLGTREERVVRRFLRESETLARLRHPNVATVHEAGVHVEELDGERYEIPYLALEPVEGGVPLDEAAEARGLSRAGRLAWFETVCDAVAHAHERGVVHRDLKPQNVLVDQHGVVKVIDFGVARVQARPDEPAPATQRTREGELVGTLTAMSPEQLEGRSLDVDTRTDVFALGVLLHRLLTGRSPFAVPDDLTAEAARRARAGGPRIDPALPRDLRAILRRALACEPDRRYADAGRLADDLRRSRAALPLEAVEASPLDLAGRFLRRHPVATTAACLLLLAGAGLAYATGAAWRQARADRTAAASAREAAGRALEEARELEARARSDAGRALAVAELLSEILADGRPEREGRGRTVGEALDRIAPLAARRFAGDPLAAAELTALLERTRAALSGGD